MYSGRGWSRGRDSYACVGWGRGEWVDRVSSLVGRGKRFFGYFIRGLLFQGQGLVCGHRTFVRVRSSVAYCIVI